MKRLFKECNLDINDQIDVKYGTINKLNPIVIYITCKAWIKLNDIYQIDNDNDIDNIFHNFKNELNRLISHSKYFDKKIIYDFNLNSNLIKNNKKFVSIEFFIKQKNNIISFNDLKDILEMEFKPSFEKLISKLQYNTFSISRSK